MGQLIQIMRADSGDLRPLCELENRTFTYDVISGRQMRYLLKSHSAMVYKAVSNEQLVGSMILLSRKKVKR